MSIDNDNIRISQHEAKNVFFTRSGTQREIIGTAGWWVVTDVYADEHALKFIAKKFELEILNGKSSPLLDLYRRGEMHLVAALMNDGLDHDVAPTPPVTQTVVKVGRYDVSVFRNATLDTIKAIMDKTIAIPPMAPDENVVKLADAAASMPVQQNVTMLSRPDWVDMTRSLEKTPVRKRRNWSFPIDVPKYGKSVIKFENGKFVDYTSAGVQDVDIFDEKSMCHSSLDVTTARGAMLASMFN